VGGYQESDPTHPLSVYARTKRKGEERVLRQNPDAVVARVVFYGWSLSGSRSLSEFFFSNLKQGNRIKGFVDTYFCPLYVEHLADTLLEMLAAGLQGVYHVVSPEHLSKYAFGVRLARKFGFDPDLIEPVEMAQGRDGAPRSLKLILDSSKIERALRHTLPSVDEGIAMLHQRWLSGYPAKLQGLQG
jgi:dTDP-4-dehydrorhamnose reductase